MKDFNKNALAAKIQGLSVQVGELFADLYDDPNSNIDSMECLEAYKSLRRLLPMDGDRHQGATAAHHATQGALGRRGR